jgi:hypothetical protein
MGNWKCVKCGNTTGSSNKPLVGTCVKGGGSVIHFTALRRQP